METILRDLRYATRIMPRSLGFAAVAVMPIKTPAYREPELIVTIRHHGWKPVVPADSLDWRAMRSRSEVHAWETRE